MSCDKPGQPQRCHLESLRGWRWRGGETWSSLVHGPQGPRGREAAQPRALCKLCLPLPPWHCVICAEELNTPAVQRQRYSYRYTISVTHNSLLGRNNLFLG